VRRVLLTGHYAGDLFAVGSSLEVTLVSAINEGELQAKELVSRYCAVLYRRLGTFEEVARRTGLDRRTVKKYLETA